MVSRDNGASEVVVEGTFLVNSFLACILFDSGASHSFISYAFMVRLQLIAHLLDTPLSVSTPLGEVSLLESVCRRCTVSLDESEFIVDLIVLHMSEFDVILGIDWLSSSMKIVESDVERVDSNSDEEGETVKATLHQ